jgi:hypothetical protein
MFSPSGRLSHFSGKRRWSSLPLMIHIFHFLIGTFFSFVDTWNLMFVNFLCFLFYI